MKTNPLQLALTHVVGYLIVQLVEGAVLPSHENPARVGARHAQQVHVVGRDGEERLGQQVHLAQGGALHSD